jgi:hypothetical protein
MMLRPRMRAVAPVLFLELMAGCQGSKGDQARKLDQERASWEATVQLTRELSGRGALPAQYSRQVMQKSSENLDKIRKQAAQLSQ